MHEVAGRAGQLIDFLPVNPNILYGVSFGLLVIFFVYTLIGRKNTENK